MRIKELSNVASGGGGEAAMATAAGCWQLDWRCLLLRLFFMPQRKLAGVDKARRVGIRLPKLLVLDWREAAHRLSGRTKKAAARVEQRADREDEKEL